MILSFENYILESELSQFDNLPTEINELFNFIKFDLTSDIYNGEFTNEELTLLENSFYNRLDKTYIKLISNENINESFINEANILLNETVGENSKRKWLRVNAKLLFHKLKQKYNDLKEKITSKNKDNPSIISKKLTDLKNWFLKMTKKTTDKNTSTELAVA